MPTTVMIVDDHPFIIEGIKSSSEDYPINVIASLTSLENVLETYIDVKPDVVIMDIRFKDSKDSNGLVACEKILSSDPEAKLIILSQFDSIIAMKKAYRLGVFAYIEKDEDEQIIIKAIESAKNGKQFFTDRVARKLAEDSFCSDNPLKTLDERDLEIFKLTAKGYLISEISDILNVTTKTVHKRSKSIKEKLNIERITDFVLLAQKHHLISNPLDEA